jgi:N-methylhydantoinase B
MVIKGKEKLERPGKFSELLRKGDVLRIETPGGGGYGD